MRILIFLSILDPSGNGASGPVALAHLHADLQGEGWATLDGGVVPPLRDNAWQG